jgi:glycosyltransferase involved in cell wall biosynthesis
LQGRGYRGLLDRFDALVVHGDTTRAALVARGVDAGRIHVTPHPPMRLAPATAADLAALPAPTRPRLLFFGTIRPYKSVDLLVEACIALWRQGHDFELVLAGKPFMDVAPILAAVAQSGFADRLLTDFGFLSESRLDAHMARAAIIAFPYRHIDSSGAFLSALHHGKAMVTSDAGMFGQLPDGVAARAPAGNAAALGQALLPLIESAAIRQDYGARARAYGEQMGSWTDMARATIGIYHHVLAGRA